MDLNYSRASNEWYSDASVRLEKVSPTFIYSDLDSNTRLIFKKNDSWRPSC